MDIKKKISIAVSILFLVLVTVVVGTYAYFNTGVNSGPKFEAGLQSGDMNLVFADNDNGINAKLMFGESVTKKFTIRNAGTLNTSLSLEWEDLINTYLNGSLSYRLEYSETEDGEYQTIVDTSNIPVSSVETTQTLASELAVPAGETYYYNLIITLNDLAEIDQSPDRDATFTTRFVANQPIRYRRYKLTVDPNGGVWEEYVNAQEYLMMYDDVKEIEDPTRSGYVFAGWENSSSSSKLEGTEFTMGIGDTTLKAIWAQESYTLTIDANGGIYSGATTVEVPFRQTTTIATPTREGYTFAGWEVSAGKLEDDTFTMNCMEDAKLTAKWVVNNYKYIVYHNQMNTSGNGYTLVSADTDEGEAAFGSTISPDTKVYQGFTAPNKQSLTIRVDNSNPPTLNKVDYNYARNKYNLTINPNGGSYNNSTTSVTEEVYYGAEKELLTPTKEGYNFANWSVTGAKLDGTTLTMSDAEATVTANYTPKTFNITFNANGGSVSTQSKVVTYDSTYEELPTPTYEGYRFLGWFTEASGGTEVVSSTQVSLTSNQTLFAHWERATVMVTLHANGNGNSITGFFEDKTVKTKTVELLADGTYGDLPKPNCEIKLSGVSGASCWTTGWFTAATGGTKITSTSKLLSNSPHTLYAQWNGMCFLEDTLVYTPNGYKKIQDLKIGDKVYSYNEKLHIVEIDEVSQVMVNKSIDYLKVTLEDDTVIRVTETHPFYDKKSDSWKPISEFEIGDTVTTSENNDIKIKSIERVEKEDIVYNMEVKNNHNYYVSKSNILVHNKGV